MKSKHSSLSSLENDKKILMTAMSESRDQKGGCHAKHLSQAASQQQTLNIASCIAAQVQILNKCDMHIFFQKNLNFRKAELSDSIIVRQIQSRRVVSCQTNTNTNTKQKGCVLSDKSLGFPSIGRPNSSPSIPLQTLQQQTNQGQKINKHTKAFCSFSHHTIQSIIS